MGRDFCKLCSQRRKNCDLVLQIGKYSSQYRIGDECLTWLSCKPHSLARSSKHRDHFQQPGIDRVFGARQLYFPAKSAFDFRSCHSRWRKSSRCWHYWSPSMDGDPDVEGFLTQSSFTALYNTRTWSPQRIFRTAIVPVPILYVGSRYWYFCREPVVLRTDSLLLTIICRLVDHPVAFGLKRVKTTKLVHL